MKRVVGDSEIRSEIHGVVGKQTDGAKRWVLFDNAVTNAAHH